MSNIEQFFVSSSSSGGQPAMPKLAGAGIKHNGSSFPAGKLITLTGITFSSGTAEGTVADTSSFPSTGTLQLSGADQTEYNGRHAYTVTSGTLITWPVSGSPVTATGTLSADIYAFNNFAGDIYVLPIHTTLDALGASDAVNRFDETDTLIWSFVIKTEWITLTGGNGSFRFLGATMNLEGNIVVAGWTENSTTPDTDTRVTFMVIDKTTGNLIDSTETTSGGGGKTFPTQSVDDNNIVFDTTFHDFMSSTGEDLTRFFMDVDSSGNYVLAGQGGGGGLVSSETRGINAIVTVNTNTTIVSNIPVRYGDGVTSIPFATQYISADGVFKVGRILTRYNPWTGELEGREFTLTKDNLEKVIDLPNDAQSFFRLDRSREDPSTAKVFWMSDRGMLGNDGTVGILTGGSVILSEDSEPNPWRGNTSERIGADFSGILSGLRAWPEPIKIWTFGEHVLLTPCPIANNASNITTVNIIGFRFGLRTEFDQWLDDSFEAR